MRKIGDICGFLPRLVVRRITSDPGNLAQFARVCEMIWLLQEIDAFDQRWPFANDVCAIAAGIDDLQLRLLAF